MTTQIYIAIVRSITKEEDGVHYETGQTVQKIITKEEIYKFDENSTIKEIMEKIYKDRHMRNSEILNITLGEAY